MRGLLLGLFLIAGCTNVEDDILPPDATATDGPPDAPIDGHGLDCACDAFTPDAGVD